MSKKQPINHECPIRDILDRIGDAWTALVIFELSKGSCRFNALRRVIDGISQRMLAQTLKNLTREGFVTRTVLPSAPPQVEYALTELGKSLNDQLGMLASWATANQPSIRAARKIFDQSQP